ncbi:unnamed protein product [Penicillium glandicola]
MIYNHLRTKPCLQHTAYDSERDEDQLPASPVLSILQFTFRPNVDVSELSESANALWRTSLGFVSTITGFQGLHWAVVSQASASQQVTVLIQWENGLAWKRFQCSVGFGMLLGYVTDIYNRCVQLSLLANISGCDLLELVSYHFTSKTPPGEWKSTRSKEWKQNFRDRWDFAFAPIIDEATAKSELIFACGDWLQRDDQFEDHYFAGMLFWSSGIPANTLQQLMESNVHGITTRMAELANHAAAVVSSMTKQLQHVSPGIVAPRDANSSEISQMLHVNHPVFKASVSPIYDTPAARGIHYKDQHHLDTVKQAASITHQRIVAGVAGRWYPMGSINQHHMPGRPQFDERHMIEIISFRAQSGNRHIDGHFKELRMKLWELEGHPLIRWGADNENAGWWTRITLLIDLRDLERLKMETQSQCQSLIERFSTMCGETLRDFSYASVFSPPQLDTLTNLEITTFEMPLNENDMLSFKHAYDRYLRGTMPQVRSGMSLTEIPAAHPKACGWVPANYLSLGDGDPTTTARFTSMISWSSQAARTEWYGDYSRRAKAEFDRVGHVVYWIQTLCKRIDTQFLLLEDLDPEIRARELEIIMNKP